MEKGGRRWKNVEKGGKAGARGQIDYEDDYEEDGGGGVCIWFKPLHRYNPHKHEGFSLSNRYKTVTKRYKPLQSVTKRYKALQSVTGRNRR